MEDDHLQGQDHFQGHAAETANPTRGVAAEAEVAVDLGQGPVPHDEDSYLHSTRY